MIVDTRTKVGIENSLSRFLDITIPELYQYIKYAENKARKGQYHFDDNIFVKEVQTIILDLEPAEKIDEIYVYHLSRRFESDKTNGASDNLKSLLLGASPLRAFLNNHGVKFIEENEHIDIIYNNRVVNLSNTSEVDVCYLRSRLGFNPGRRDYCFNGFAMRDLLMYNSYTRELYHGPEFIIALSRFLKNDKISEEYFNTSKYYCFTYRLKMSDIIFDCQENLLGEEKIIFFISQLFNRLSEYCKNPQFLSDIENPIIRIKDDAGVMESSLVEKEEITVDMIQN